MKHISNKLENTVKKSEAALYLNSASDHEKSTVLVSIYSVVAELTPHIPNWAMPHPS